jgi:Na+-driven multidrug efflux pump
MIGTNFFQSLGLVKKSIILSLSRQLLMLIPLLYILPQLVDGVDIFGLKMLSTDGVWLSFPISDLLSTILTVILLRRLFKKFNTLHDGDSSKILDGQL